nr:winged helix-turn-helix domain-containing protein [Saccharopolyspora erythraea]
MQAAEMFGRGERQVDVATVLGVSQQTASRWRRAWSSGGPEALAGAGRAGRISTLCDEQLAAIETELLNGPRAGGFPAEMWTLARVTEVIERLTGVRYSQSQTWVSLRRRLGWSRQRPARRAVERDEAAIEEWVKTEWPRIKPGPGAEGPGSASKTRADPGSAAPFFLDTDVDVGRAGLPA